MSERLLAREMSDDPRPVHAADEAVNGTVPAADLGLLYVCITPLLTAGSINAGFDFGGFNLGGWIWFLQLLAGIYLLWSGAAGRPPLTVHQPCRHWMAWLGILWISLVWCDNPGRMNVQEALQISMPVLVAAVSSMYIRSAEDLHKLLRAFAWSLVPLGLIILATRTGIIQLEGTGNRDAALSVALVGCVFLARAATSPLLGYASWIGCIGLIILSSSRMATVALVIVILFHPSYKSHWKRLAALAAMLACSLAVFYSPMFQERTFYKGQGSISDLAEDGVDTAGRFETWPLIWDESWKRPILGAGAGSAREFVLSVWPDVAHPHNDYLRVGFECGLVGLAIYLGAVFRQLTLLYRESNRFQGVIQQAFIASFLGILIMLFTSATDNTLVYNLCYTDPLFALMGGAYGAAAACPREASRA